MKFTKRFLGLALSMMVAVVSNPMNVLAEESAQTMQIIELDSETEASEVVYEGINNFEMSNKMRGSSITGASLRVTPRTSEILIEMSTTCSFTATKVGVKNVYVQEKVWYGWKTIAQTSGYAANTYFFSGQTTCTSVESGKKYRVVCTHYAIESNGTEHTVSNQSTEFVF